jgi:hypothetical protein
MPFLLAEWRKPEKDDAALRDQLIDAAVRQISQKSSRGGSWGDVASREIKLPSMQSRS